MAAELRRKHLASTAPMWTALKSTLSCLFCLRRPPEHVLSCGHTMCDTCIQIFGVGIAGAEYCFAVSRCVLCLARTELSACLKPPGVGPCLLSIGGGGVRGVVALVFLSALQDCLGLCYPLQEYFDSVIGTSSGMTSCRVCYCLLTPRCRCIHRPGLVCAPNRCEELLLPV